MSEERKTTLIKYGIASATIVLSVIIVCCSIISLVHSKNEIRVTGLGEQTFVSDKIVWTGRIQVETSDKIAGYNKIGAQQKIVSQYLSEKGIVANEVTFSFVSVDKEMRPVYNAQGNYTGSVFSGYTIYQTFTVVSNDVDKVEAVSREISSVIAQGVDISSNMPEYYYTHLDDLKLSLIEQASADARSRAQKIVVNAGAKLGKANNASLGVFQITSATGNETYSEGGTFNTWSKEKRACITVRVTYTLK